MAKLSLEFIEESIEFTKEQKIKLMQFAMADKDYIERTNQVQKEMDELLESWL